MIFFTQIQYESECCNSLRMPECKDLPNSLTFFSRSLQSLLLRSFACRPARNYHVKTLIRNSLQAKGYMRKRHTIFEHDARTQWKSTANHHKHVFFLTLAGSRTPKDTWENLWQWSTSYFILICTGPFLTRQTLTEGPTTPKLGRGDYLYTITEMSSSGVSTVCSIV